jgi:chromatin-remodeling ATPase INO80
MSLSRILNDDPAPPDTADRLPPPARYPRDSYAHNTDSPSSQSASHPWDDPPPSSRRSLPSPPPSNGPRSGQHTFPADESRNWRYSVYNHQVASSSHPHHPQPGPEPDDIPDFRQYEHGAPLKRKRRSTEEDIDYQPTKRVSRGGLLVHVPVLMAFAEGKGEATITNSGPSSG